MNKFTPKHKEFMSEVVRNTEFISYVNYYLPTTGRFTIDFMRDMLLCTRPEYDNAMAKEMNSIRSLWLRYKKLTGGSN